jgi:hypothetical protein
VDKVVGVVDEFAVVLVDENFDFAGLVFDG